MAKVAVFASGRGSNFIAIYEYLKRAADQRHQICCLVSDRPACPAVQFARDHGIPVLLMAYAKGKTRESIEEALLGELGPLQPDLVVLAGFMRLLSPVLVQAFRGRLINIHPSLLPKYPGTHGIEESYASGDRLLGITIHQVDEGLDSGPIIIQKSFERRGSESLADIEQRIHELEHQTYPMVVEALLNQLAV